MVSEPIEAGQYHYRDKDQDEVDLVIETGISALVGIEVKASATVNAGDFKGLRKLAEACDDNFKLAQLSQLRTFFGFFALIFVVRPCVFIVAL